MNSQMLRRLGALATLAGLAVLLPAGTASADPSTCPDANVCFWSQSNYNGNRVTSTGFYQQWGELLTDGSVKNKFSNRKVQIGHTTSSGINVIECLNPEPDVFKVGDQGSRC
jgi:hypothetical protein